MSAPAVSPGLYNIVNNAASSGPVPLYLTFPNQNTNLFVNTSDGSSFQIWNVSSDAGTEQSISPYQTRLDVVGIAAGDYIQAQPGSFRWSITYQPSQGLYTIESLNRAFYWDLDQETAAPGRLVVLAAGNGNPTQYWNFIQA